MLFKLVALLCAFRCVFCTNQTLVLLDDWSIRESHSLFFKNLRSDGIEISFKMADDKALTIQKYEFGGDVDVKKLLDFVDSGGNILIAAASQSSGAMALSDSVRDVAAQVGVEVDTDDTVLVDHVTFDRALDETFGSGRHTVLNIDPASQMIGKSKFFNNRINPILYHGIGMTADTDNELVLPLLHGAPTTYSASYDTLSNPGDPDEVPHAIGTQAMLVALLQARNNARVAVAGSLHLFSDAYAAASVKNNKGKMVTTGNAEFCRALAMWVLKQSGVIRVSDVHHYHADIPDAKNPASYTIKEHVVVSLSMEEWRDGAWAPFAPSDVQIELVRIDPFVRNTLKPVANGKRLEAKIQLPDVYGVYQIQIDYNRLGYTHIFHRTQVSVRPLEHTQYERFISSAYPYYMSAFSMMLSTFLLSFVWLHHRPSKEEAALMNSTPAAPVAEPTPVRKPGGKQRAKHD